MERFRIAQRAADSAHNIWWNWIISVDLSLQDRLQGVHSGNSAPSPSYIDVKGYPEHARDHETVLQGTI
jgi:hypothetical protein